MNIENITWTNLGADIYLGLHANAVRLYMNSVVGPALDAIDARHAELERDDDPVAAFMKADVEQLRKSAFEAFALAIQSLWERQLREFLMGCARELKCSDALVKSLATDDWTKLVKHFGDLRGVPLEVFDSFEELDLLQLLGNACRHGEGKSATMLHARWPELWPEWPPSLPGPWPPLPGSEAPPPLPPFSTISVPRAARQGRERRDLVLGGSQLHLHEQPYQQAPQRCRLLAGHAGGSRTPTSAAGHRRYAHRRR